MHTYHQGILSHARFYSVSLEIGPEILPSNMLPGDADGHFGKGFEVRRLTVVTALNLGRKVQGGPMGDWHHFDLIIY